MTKYIISSKKAEAQNPGVNMKYYMCVTTTEKQNDQSVDFRCLL